MSCISPTLIPSLTHLLFLENIYVMYHLMISSSVLSSRFSNTPFLLLFSFWLNLFDTVLLSSYHFFYISLPYFSNFSTTILSIWFNIHFYYFYFHFLQRQPLCKNFRENTNISNGKTKRINFRICRWRTGRKRKKARNKNHNRWRWLLNKNVLIRMEKDEESKRK